MIDKNEAPEGFEAVESDYYDCVYCYYSNEHCASSKDAHCLAIYRKDGHDVIFVKKEDRNEN